MVTKRHEDWNRGICYELIEENISGYLEGNIEEVIKYLQNIVKEYSMPGAKISIDVGTEHEYYGYSVRIEVDRERPFTDEEIKKHEDAVKERKKFEAENQKKFEEKKKKEEQEMLMKMAKEHPEMFAPEFLEKLKKD